ncbi:MAG: hypothetical protein JXA01_01790 [Dehalococcoidia bacterium]|nr:hypothetical protein [Dehalococcoidia bacterium]
MPKLISLLAITGLVLAIVFSFLIPSSSVLADDNNEVTVIGDVADPGILPDSGFYFMKSWGRSLQLIFAGSETEKAGLMLRYTNEDALALKQMYTKGKYDVGAKYSEQYELQLQNTVMVMEQVRERQGESAAEELVAKLEQNYLQQQEVLLSVLENAPEAAQNGLLNAIENSNKYMGVMVLAHKGQAALEQYQEQVNQQTNNMGQAMKIRVQQRLSVTHGQAVQTSTGSTGQGSETQTQSKTQMQSQTQIQNQNQSQSFTQTQTQTQLQTQTQTQTTQNQGSGQPNTDTDSSTQGTGNKKQGK